MPESVAQLQSSSEQPDKCGAMLWFFEKERERLQYEIRREPDGQRIELVITWPDGREQVEAYDDPADVQARSEMLQNRLAATGWQAPATCNRDRARASAE